MGIYAPVLLIVMEELKKIPVSTLETGMSFDQPVFIDPYNILIETGQALAEKDLETLEVWGIQEVKSHGNILDYSIEGEKQKEKNNISSPSPSPSPQTAPIHDIQLPLLKYKNYYERFRKAIPAFSKELKQNSAALEKSFKDILTKKISQVYQIEQVADFLVESIINFPLLIILLRYTNFNPNWTLSHLIHSAAYGILFSRFMGYSRTEIRNLTSAILTMDIGMFAVPSSIRNKERKLETEEVELLKKHPFFSYRLLQSGTGRKAIKVAKLVLQHHEAYDGTGYPRGLRGKNIDQKAMVAKICDNFAALIEKRPFRNRILPAIALKNLISNSGKRFDPDLLRAFIKTVSNYPLSSFVRLSDGRVGMVISFEAEKLNTPVIRLFRNSQRQRYHDLEFVDLSGETSLEIQEAVSPISLHIDPVKEL